MSYTTIGALRGALSDLDPEAEVYIDNRRPTALSSYRGYYDHLAIERSEAAAHHATELDEPGRGFDASKYGLGYYQPGSSEVRIKSPATVGELVKGLDLADGATFEGYKGGQYTMDAASDLWVSEYGTCDSLRITGIESLPGRVDLLTTEEGR